MVLDPACRHVATSGEKSQEANIDCVFNFFSRIAHHLVVLGGMTVLFLGIGASVFKWTQD